MSETQGTPGPRGRVGADGKAGPVGPAGASAATKLLILFIFVVCVFAFLGYRIQQNTEEIEQTRLIQEMERCVNGAEILAKFNKFLTDMAAVERAGIKSGEDPAVTPTRQERIRIYEQTQISLPDCSSLPLP